jgi:hypothetical protein
LSDLVEFRRLRRRIGALMELLSDCEPYLRTAAPRSDTRRTPNEIHDDILDVIGVPPAPYDPDGSAQVGRDT